MYNAGLGGPFPVMFSPIRRRGLTAGSIILTEHVGAVDHAKFFVRSRFALMTAQARESFLRELTAFWHKLHECGIYRLQLRYIHCAERDLSDISPYRLYLFDLDKVLVSPWFSRLFGGLLARRDNRSLRRWLANHLTAEEAQLCRQLLSAAGEPSAAEAKETASENLDSETAGATSDVG